MKLFRQKTDARPNIRIRHLCHLMKKRLFFFVPMAQFGIHANKNKRQIRIPFVHIIIKRYRPKILANIQSLFSKK